MQLESVSLTGLVKVLCRYLRIEGSSGLWGCRVIAGLSACQRPSHGGTRSCCLRVGRYSGLLKHIDHRRAVDPERTPSSLQVTPETYQPNTYDAGIRNEKNLQPQTQENSSTLKTEFFGSGPHEFLNPQSTSHVISCPSNVGSKIWSAGFQSHKRKASQFSKSNIRPSDMPRI